MADKYYRVVCFVVDICADVLRKYFVKLAKIDAGNTYTSVDAYLSHRNWDVMQLFNNKKLRRDQYDLLYPINGTADESKWDVSILITLITELFVTRLQPLEVFALKTEIRGIRNEVQHHPNTENISDNDFDDYWERLDSSVRLLAKNALDPNDEASLLRKINQVKCNHLPNLSNCLRIWHEETSKQLLNIMNEVQANAEETTSILRQVTVQKPGPSGDKNKRIKVADDILARLQAGFESTMKELSDDFNPPSEVTDIRAKLRDYHHVLVTGCNNSRYFETALAAIKGMDYNYKRCVEMHTSSDWRHIDPEDVDLVVCRDPFGRISYDESKAKAMDDIFKSIMHSTRRDYGDKALDIVIVTDLKILEECKMHHDHELLDEVVKVFTDTSSTQPADLTIGCRRQGQYAQSSSLPVTRNNLGAMTKHFLMAYKISSGQVDDQILKKAKRSFKANKAIVLTGHEKCGQTSIAVALASAYEEQQCLLLKKPNDVNYIDFPNTCLVIIDEFAGKYRYEENEVYEWYNMFDYLYNAVIAEPLNVIITCEKGKLDKCINEIGRHAILDHVVVVPLQTTVVKLEVTEQYGHESGQIVTADHFTGTISNITQTQDYTSSLLADPSQGPILLSRHDTIPVSTENTSILEPEYGHVRGQLANTDQTIGTISNTSQSKNYTAPLSVVPLQSPILQFSHNGISLFTGNTSLLGRAQMEGIQNPMPLKRGFSGMERVIQTETDDFSVKRSRSMSSGLWSVREEHKINIRTNGDIIHSVITGSCILPSGEILLADYNNRNLKKLDNMYNVKCVCDLPNIPYDLCYVGDNVAVVSLWSKLQFVDTTHSMTLRISIDTDHICGGLACYGNQMYVRDNYDSVYSYSTVGIKQQMIYSSRNVYYIFNKTGITVSNDGSKLYLTGKNELVTIDNNGNHLFTYNEDIHGSCGVCVDDQGYVYVNDRNGNIIQISEDGRTILQVITNLSHMADARLRTLTFDRKNKALIAAGRSDTISVVKLR